MNNDMHNDKNFYDHTIGMARWPAPSDDLFNRIMSRAQNIPPHIRLKASALLMGLFMTVFAAGFLHSAPSGSKATDTTPYYTGSGLSIVKYMD